jgi:hypothetical protein
MPYPGGNPSRVSLITYVFYPVFLPGIIEIRVTLLLVLDR